MHMKHNSIFDTVDVGAAMRIAACLVAIALATLPHAWGAERDSGPIMVESSWTRATPRGSTVAGGYLTLKNVGTASDRLLGGSLSAAEQVQIHNMTIQDGVARMREVTQGVEIKPGESFDFEPGGSHLMFVGLKRPLVAGDKIEGTLTFERAGSVKVVFEVMSMGAGAPHHH
jgi:periplasmic copper chaperone A